MTFSGPAIVEDASTTVVIFPDKCTVDDYANLHINTKEKIMPKKIDPITVEIIQSSLQAACDEMFIAMRKTAMSSIIYEVLDFGTAVTDSNGNIAASGVGIPAIAACDKAVQAVLNKFDDKEIKPGDIFATNDPYNGGVTHLKMLWLCPFFLEKRIAWTANIAHCDLGGWPQVAFLLMQQKFSEGLNS